MNKISKKGIARLLVLNTLIAVSALADNPLLPANFAYHANIADSANSLREMTLPGSVLEGIRRKDFGDLRVFNAQQQTVPHQFISATSEPKAIQTDLNFYPFNREQAADASSVRIQILQHSGEQSIHVESPPSQSASSNEYQYIAENKNNSQNVCALDLDWQQPKPSMVLPLKVESSDDLQNWTTLNDRASISRLDYAGSQLVHAKIEFRCHQRDYLRLTWLKPENGLSLKRITAVYEQPQQTLEQQKSIGKPQLDGHGNWVFSSGNTAPINQIALIAPTDGLLYKGRLYSRADSSSAWRFHQAFIQYRLKINDIQLASDPIKLHGVNDAEWKIELDDTAQFTTAQLPDLQLGWAQQKLVFLAQGEAPFMLAFGNADIPPASNNGINQLIRTLQDAGQKPDEVALMQAVANSSMVKVQKSTPWKLIGLWTFLILGTGVLGYMAFHLYRQMNEKNIK